MKKYLLILVLLLPFFASAQAPLYYPSNYIRVVQPDVDDPALKYVYYDKPGVAFDTLLNPFTGGMNNPVFYNIDLNGDGIQDLFVFDRELLENQFLLFQADQKSSRYRFAPQYESAFPAGMNTWASLADYNKDGLPDIFTASNTINTGIMVFKNTSYTNPLTHQYKIQFQNVTDTLFFYCNGQREPIDISTTSNPEIVDVDKDGYLDILAFDEGLSELRFFRNSGKGRDSLSFYSTKACWGYFAEAQQHHFSPYNCEMDNLGHAVNNGTCDSGYHKNGARIFNSLCAMDVEPDGDLDLLVGDGLNDSLTLLKNGRDRYHIDTIINISFQQNDDTFPIDQPAVIHSMPTVSNLDIDHDHLKDLVIAAGQPTYLDSFSNARMHNVWYYNNEGDSTEPINIFELKTKDFLLNTMVDWGINSAPCFIDVDKDGRKDLIMAVKDGNDSSGYSHLVLYLNKAGQNAGARPYLLYQTDNYLNFSALKASINSPKPAAYLNGKDGKTDLLMGNDSGRVMYFKDLATSTKPANFKLVQSSLQYLANGKMLPVWVGRNSAPTTADINGDGKTDLLIGNSNGTISYYRCQGYGPAPEYIPYFVLVTNSFGSINATPGSDGESAPCVADLDKDGKPDLLLGDRYGNLLYYHDFDTVGILTPSPQCLAYDYGTGQRSTGKLFSTYTVPAVGYLDQDSFPDIMLGCRRGGLFFLGSAKNPLETIRNSGIEAETETPLMHINLYPNPARDHIALAYDNPAQSRNATLVITNMLGRQVLVQPFMMTSGKGTENISLANLASGIYAVNVLSGNSVSFNGKMIVMKTAE